MSIRDQIEACADLIEVVTGQRPTVVIAPTVFGTPAEQKLDGRLTGSWTDPK